MGSKVNITNIFIAGVFSVALAAMLWPQISLPSKTRSLYFLWESGHIVLFFLACHLFSLCIPQIAHRPFSRQAMIFCGSMGLCAIIIEGLQIFISGKELEVRDIINDCIGICLFLLLRGNHRLGRKAGIYPVVCFLLAIALWPALWSFADEMLARYQFPLLAGFETPFEASRFNGIGAAVSISEQHVYHGKSSLKLVYHPGPWSGVRLHYLPSDWRGYSYVNFALYNPGDKQVSVEARVEDELNRKPGNKQYNDLLGQGMSLPPGRWTPARIALADIHNAPKTRHVDLTKITGIGFYMGRHESQVTLYLDALKLE